MGRIQLSLRTDYVEGTATTPVAYIEPFYLMPGYRQKGIARMIINKLLDRINPEKLFLIDSIGALVTAFMLGFVLVQFQNIFGVPKDILYILSLIALIYSIYSFVCYLKIKTTWRPFLKGIAIANLTYCLITIGLMISLHSQITYLGILYFSSEVIIILGLVILELKKAAKISGKKLALNDV